MRSSRVVLWLVLLACATGCVRHRRVPSGELRPEMPAACDRGEVTPAHWDRASVLLVPKNDRRAWKDTRDESARSMVRPHDSLATYTADDFRDRFQPVAFLYIDKDHQELKRGRYCVTLTHQPTRGSVGMPSAWLVHYFRMPDSSAAPGAPRPLAIARDTLLYRKVHPTGQAVPPVTRFEFLTVQEVAGIRADPNYDPSVAIIQAAKSGRTSGDDEWLMTAVWFRCGNGCCSGGMDRLAFYDD